MAGKGRAAFTRRGCAGTGVEQSNLAAISPLVLMIGVSLTGLMALWLQIQRARLFPASAESLVLLLSLANHCLRLAFPNAAGLQPFLTHRRSREDPWPMCCSLATQTAQPDPTQQGLLTPQTRRAWLGERWVPSPPAPRAPRERHGRDEGWLSSSGISWDNGGLHSHVKVRPVLWFVFLAWPDPFSSHLFLGLG